MTGYETRPAVMGTNYLKSTLTKVVQLLYKLAAVIYNVAIILTHTKKIVVQGTRALLTRRTLGRAHLPTAR